jgi:hypothetical protein
VLSITGSVRYEVEGMISASGEDAPKATFILPSGERYAGALSLLDILRAVDGVRTIRLVIDSLSTKYALSSADAIEAVLASLDSLVRERLLRVVRF